MIETRIRTTVLVSLAVFVLAAWYVVAGVSEKGKGHGKPVLPPAAAAAIKKAFPTATIKEVEREKEGIVLYEVELKRNGGDVEVEVTADGQIVAVESKVKKADLPAPVAKTLARLAGRAKIKEIEREKIYAVVKMVKLAKPQVVYEAEFVRNGKEIEVKIAEDGKFLGEKVKDEEDDEDEHEEHEKEVTLDQVPAAVKATILKAAGGNKIKEIEVQTRGARKIYEAEWESGGKEIEIKVASDGTLLGREVEDKDDDD